MNNENNINRENMNLCNIRIMDNESKTCFDKIIFNGDADNFYCLVFSSTSKMNMNLNLEQFNKIKERIILK
jgi:hypothetical protein